MKINSLKHYFTTYRKKFLLSCVISFFLLVFGYFVNNWGLFTGEDVAFYGKLETLIALLENNNEDVCDDAVFVNVGYNKELIPYNANNGEGSFLGYTDITNRSDLYSLLYALKDVEYKYIILDVAFKKGLNSENYVLNKETGDSANVDKLLFELIGSMKRIVIPKPIDACLIDSSLEEKSALAYFSTTAASTNFVRYKYFDNGPFIPLTVYNDLRKELGKDTVICHYPFGIKTLAFMSVYTQGYSLCYNSLFLDFKIGSKGINGFYDLAAQSMQIADHIKNLPDILDEDTLTFEKGEEMKAFCDECEDKYIIIGDFYGDDIHDTYAGKKPGALILYKAIKALDEGKHMVSLLSLTLLFLLYFGISFGILGRNKLLNILPKGNKINNGILCYINDILTFTSILLIFHIVEYIFFRVSYSFTIAVFVFTLLRTYMTLLKEYKMKNYLLLLLFSIFFALILSSFKSPDIERREVKVIRYTSRNIHIDDRPIEKGMVFNLDSKISFPSLEDRIIAKAKKNINIGNTVWRAATTKQIFPIQGKKKLDLKWWLDKVGTYIKGPIENEIFVSGDSTAFEIEQQISDPNRQYYRFEILEGEYKGMTFEARGDDEDPVIWFFREDLDDCFNCMQDQSFKCRMEYVNHDIVADSSIIIFHYIR